MAQLNDVVESYNKYCAWVKAGRQNEDLGEDLQQDVKDSVRGFLLSSGSLDEISMNMIKHQTNLPIEAISDTEVSIELPIDASGDKFETLVVQAS